jgi:hypothetical protein
MKTASSPSGTQWSPVSLEEARAAREWTREITVRTPLVRFDYDTDAEMYLKLECLQPIRSFKLRGASECCIDAAEEFPRTYDLNGAEAGIAVADKEVVVAGDQKRHGACNGGRQKLFVFWITAIQGNFDRRIDRQDLFVA